jgi:hypothetical protein
MSIWKATDGTRVRGFETFRELMDHLIDSTGWWAL